MEDPLKELEEHALNFDRKRREIERTMYQMDFERVFADIAKVVREVKESLSKETAENKGELSKKVDEALAQIAKKQEELVSVFNKKTTETVEASASDRRTTMRYIDQKIGDIEDYNDTEVRNLIQSVSDALNALKIPEAYNDTEVKKRLKKLEDDVEELKKRPVGSGGGVTNMRIAQAFKYILKTEEPVGAIDGANLTYTLSQPIFAILSMSLNGEIIAQLPNYTINGRNFTFTEALPSAYANKDWEVKYI